MIDGDIKSRKFVAYYIKDRKVVAVAAMGRYDVINSLARVWSKLMYVIRGPAAIAALQLLKLDKMPTEKEVRGGKVDLEQRVKELTA